MMWIPAVARGVLAFALSSVAQVAPPAEVKVPLYPNSTCPVMGKPTSTKLFVDTEMGRIYVCCKSCGPKIMADVATAHRAAYPTTRKLANKSCPITGKEVPTDAPNVLLQGQELSLCCPKCVAPAKKETQIALAKGNNARIADIGNATCPITDKPVVVNVFCLIGDALVRLSSTDCVDAVRKDPKAALERARTIKAGAAPTNATKDETNPARGG